MTATDQTGPGKGLVERVKGILLRPKAEWEVIDGEPASIQGLYVGYVAPLAAIPAVAGAIGMSLVGVGVFGISYKTPLGYALAEAVTQWLLALVGVFVIALIIEALAPTFGGTKDRLKAFKLAAYAFTPAWLAGVLLLLPSLGMIAYLLGLYGFYLLYAGIPILMKSPPDKALPYAGLAIVAAIVVMIVIGVATRAVTATLPFGPRLANNAPAGTVRLGDASVDLGKLAAASRQAEETAKRLQAQAEGKIVEGGVEPVSVDVLKGMLPGSIAGLGRTEVSSGSGGVAGIEASNAQADYQAGDARITLSISDTAGMGGLAGLMGALNVNSSSETATGYEKMGTVNGRMTNERYDRQARSGEYGVMVGSRFMVQAEGSNVSMEQLKAAVSAVDLRRLEGLAKG